MALMTFGEKYPEKDVDHFYDCARIEDNKMDAQYLSDMLLGRLNDDEAQ